MLSQTKATPSVCKERFQEKCDDFRAEIYIHKLQINGVYSSPFSHHVSMVNLSCITKCIKLEMVCIFLSKSKA